MPETTLERLCRRWRIVVTTPKFPPPQCPKQLLFIVVVGNEHPPIREDDLCGEQIVQRQTGAADQWPVAAAQCEPGHADAAACARHCRQSEWICYRDDV